jgi:autotransporter-associated beta strand protein
MAGASVTIQGGTFSSNSVVAGMSEGNLDNGSAAMNGSAYGSDLFLGGDVTFNVTNGSSLSVNSLGGAGNLSDPNVSNNATDPNAQGGIIKTGSGTLTMTGSNYFTGATTLHQGAVVLGGGALEQGTSQVIVGQNNGDDATLNLGSNSTLNVSYGTNPAVILGQNAGSAGTVLIGNGAGSSGAYVGANVFQGGIGGGVVKFQQEYAAGTNVPSVYPFYTALTGNLRIVQDGPGTTLLQPLSAYGPNTFTGGVVVDQGTLQLGTNTALPSGNAINLNGGIFDLNGNSASVGVLTLNGGTLTNSGGNQAITPTNTVTTSGVIAASIAGLGGLTQQGVGTTTITSTTGFTGAATVQQGSLMALVSGALGGTTNMTVETGGTFTLGASDAVNTTAPLFLNSGTVRTVSNLSQTLGDWTLQNTSTLDFSGNAASFSFSGLSINGSLAIWNWNALTDSICITGAYSGDLSQIIFYSDSGLTDIGTGTILNNQLQAVPEPSTYALVSLSALLLVISVRRRAVESI